MAEMYNILVVDDDEGWIEIIKDYLKVYKKYNIETCTTREQALDYLGKNKTNVILLDYHLGSLEYDGISLASEFKHKTEAKILMLTISDNKKVIQNSILAGALDYINKADYKETLVPGIERALHNENAEIIVEAMREDKISRLFEKLTPREEEIFDLCRKGTSSKEIIRLLVISEYTYRNHISNIIKKLKVKNVKEAVALWEELYRY